MYNNKNKNIKQNKNKNNIKKQNKKRYCKIEARPEADTGDETHIEEQTTEQNIVFAEENPGEEVIVPSIMDPIRDVPMSNDATLAEFFKRPVLIQDLTWNDGDSLFSTFNPWEIFMANKRVANRIANFKLGKGTLCVKLVLNGTPFHYGTGIMEYNPFPVTDNLTKRRQNNDYDLISASQRPHIYFIPTTCQGGCLRLPFFFPKNVWDMSTEDWASMGDMCIRSVNVLRHALGSTENVAVTVFAWLEDSDIAIPTEYMSGNAIPQADEHSGVVSRPAGIVAALAGKLADACPPIAPYCLPVVQGASMVASVAKVFGYSKPTELRQTVMVPRIKETLANTDGMDTAVKLSVDSKQGLTIDPRTVGLGSQDEMDINYIASTESYLTTFAWKHADPLESRLFSSVVDPCIHGQFGDELHFPAMCYAAMPFENWRGSIKFRFQVACSAMHKGRLRIVWDPEGVPAAGAGYNTAYATIIDISHTTDYTMTVGWGQATTYRDHFTPEDLEDDMYPDPVFYKSSETRIGNGVLSVYVLNNLMSPGSLSTPVSVNVFVSGGDDLEFAAPDGRYINRLRVSAIGNIPTPQIQPSTGGSKVTVTNIASNDDVVAPPDGNTDLEFQKLLTEPWFLAFQADNGSKQPTDVLYYAATKVAYEIQNGLIPVVPNMPNIYDIIVDAGGAVTKAATNYWKLTVWKDDTSALNTDTIHEFLKNTPAKTMTYAGNEWNRDFDALYASGYAANSDVGFAWFGQTFVMLECFDNYARHPDNVFPPIGPTGPARVRARPEAVEAENDEGDTVGQVQPWSDGTNYIHYGESIKSFRNLVKRYNRHEILPLNDVITPGSIRVQSFERTSLPFEPGYTDAPLNAQSIPYLLSQGKYAFGYMTLVRYLTLGYGGWRGGMRYIYEMPPSCCSLNGVAVTRCASCANENKTTDVLVPTDASRAGATAGMLNLYDDSSGQEGEAIFRQEINPLVSFEVPYYSILRFSSGKTTTNFATNNSSGEPSFKVRYTKSSSNEPLGVIRTHVAAAEDFNLFMFLGAPVFFYEPGSPTT